MTTEDVLAMSDDEAITSALLLDAQFKARPAVHIHDKRLWSVWHPSWRIADGLFTNQASAARAYLIARLNLER